MKIVMEQLGKNHLKIFYFKFVKYVGKLCTYIVYT